MNPEKKRLVDPAQVMFNDTANVLKIKLNCTNYTDTCHPKFIVRKCDCGTKIFPQGCQKKSCVTCQPFLSSRRADKTLERFKTYEKHCNKIGVKFVMLYTDFTIPMSLRSKCMDNKYWKSIRDKVFIMLKKHFNALFAVEATHPISESNPGKFHPHLNFLWCQTPGGKPFLDVTKLRKMYRDILGYHGDVDCHHDYSDIKARIVHWCNYVTRLFPAYADWTGNLRWFGTYPKAIICKNNLCPCCGTQLFTLGWIDHYKIEDYYTFGLSSGRAPPWEDFKNINFFKRKK